MQLTELAETVVKANSWYFKCSCVRYYQYYKAKRMKFRDQFTNNENLHLKLKSRIYVIYFNLVRLTEFTNGLRFYYDC